MSIFIDRNSRLVVQGITGRDGSFHTRQTIDYGTNVVAGVTPGKGGQRFEGRVPIFNTVAEAVTEAGANTAVIYVPARFAADAVYEAADAGVALVVCISEGVPVLDMTRVMPYLRERGVRLIGPNCPGLISPGRAKVGIIPGQICREGSVGVVSRSGECEFLDSTFIGDLVVTWQKAKAKGGKLKLVKPGNFEQTVFHLNGTIEIFETYDSVEQALSSFIIP